ncbi:MAG: FkbM family methyltransferase [Thalassobaculum sp.]
MSASEDHPSFVPPPDAVGDLVERALTFADNGNRIGVIAALGGAAVSAEDGTVRMMLLRALAPLTSVEGRAAFLRQCAHLSPTLPAQYAAAREATVARGLKRAALPDRMTASDDFIECVTFKSLINETDNPLIGQVMAVVSDYFGRRAAQAMVGGALPMARLAGDVFTVGLGSGAVKLRQRSEETNVQGGLFFMYEPGLIRWIAGFTPDDVFLDIGANIGKYALTAARLTAARTYALEPFSTNVEALEDNIRLNGLEGIVTPLRLALSDRTGVADLGFGRRSAGEANQNLVHTLPSAGVSTEPVETARLDDLIDAGRVPTPTRIKIDVDGEEWRLINGMRRTLLDPRLTSIRIEIRPSDANAAAIRRIEDSGFIGASDDDAKNVLFMRRVRPLRT